MGAGCAPNCTCVIYFTNYSLNWSIGHPIPKHPWNSNVLGKAMSTTTNPTNHGPLTTTFTPSPECFKEKWTYYATSTAELVWGEHRTTLGDGSGLDFDFETSCFPEGLMNVVQSTSFYQGTINQVFSPGYICPSGWKSVLGSTYGVQGTENPDFGEVYVTMEPDDIVTVCCPK